MLPRHEPTEADVRKFLGIIPRDDSGWTFDDELRYQRKKLKFLRLPPIAPPIQRYPEANRRGDLQSVVIVPGERIQYSGTIG